MHQDTIFSDQNVFDFENKLPNSVYKEVLK